MEMGLGRTDYGTTLPDSLKAGRITIRQLDDAVRPILETKIRLGLFEHPYVDEAQAKDVLNDPDHRAEAMHSAERSAVLLRNQGGLLPLQAARYKSIAVLGPLADSNKDTIGSWVSANDAGETVTVLQALERQAGSETHVEYAPGVQIARTFPSPFDGTLMVKKQAAWSEGQAAEEFAKAVQIAQRSDISVMVLGEAQNMSGESASRSSLELPGKQQQLLEAVVATGKPVTLVLLNGRPLNISWAAEHVPAILEAWYPGEFGGRAIAETLFGDNNPGGKLTITFPRNVGQLPDFYNADPSRVRKYVDDDGKPLFPFGYGLSYSSFAYARLTAQARSTGVDGDVAVTVDVTNSGDRAGDEVAQLYMRQDTSSVETPERSLKGFERIHLMPHETKTVHFSIPMRELEIWNAQDKWVVEPGKYTLWAGGSSQADLTTSFQIKQ